MSELRQDRTSGAWAIVAPERRRRPGDWTRKRDAPAMPLKRFDPDCPFCPGNERELPGIIEAVPAEGDPGWAVRVVPNKYPVMSAQEAAASATIDAHVWIAGHGFHEVIIESPLHDRTLASFSHSELETIVAVYHRRYAALSARDGIRSVVLFRNFGHSAGASLRHPHAQILALNVVPPRLATMTQFARARYAWLGQCVTCAELALEKSEKSRIVEENDDFVLLVPFAAASPFELWIVPKRHQASFAQMNAREQSSLASALSHAQRRLDALLGEIDCNLVVESPGGTGAASAANHWRLRIVPDLVTPGGFELGTGLPINPSQPEEDAAALRAASITR